MFSQLPFPHACAPFSELLSSIYIYMEREREREAMIRRQNLKLDRWSNVINLES